MWCGTRVKLLWVETKNKSRGARSGPTLQGWNSAGNEQLLEGVRLPEMAGAEQGGACDRLAVPPAIGCAMPGRLFARGMFFSQRNTPLEIFDHYDHLRS
jgi:hypothetical protein